MSRTIIISSLALAVIMLFSGVAFAAPSFLSTTGGILAPDDTRLQPGEFSANIHMIRMDGDAMLFGANVGVTEALELGIARFDPDVPGVGGSTLLNAKYLVLPETPARPSLLIGLVDAAGDLDPDGDPGFYLVVGKNLTPITTEITGQPIAPLRGWVGVGTGIYGGVFLGAEYTFSPRARIIGEFINELNMRGTGRMSSVLNAGLRVAITDNLRADVALIDGSDFGIGVSYTHLGF